MSKALIVIDYTADFVAPDGALTCGEPGRQIEAAITALAAGFIADNSFVVFATDIHDPASKTHPENALFPPHNVAGTPGRALYGALGELYKKNARNPDVYFMDKTRYSAFAGTDLLLRLRERRIDELHVCGVCTDICVLHTLVDAYNLGFSCVVHERCVASFNTAGHQWALGHFKDCLGAEVV